MQQPKVGDIILITGPESNKNLVHPAIVTSVVGPNSPNPAAPADSWTVNCTVFQDAGKIILLSEVVMYATGELAHDAVANNKDIKAAGFHNHP